MLMWRWGGGVPLSHADASAIERAAECSLTHTRQSRERSPGAATPLADVTNRRRPAAGGKGLAARVDLYVPSAPAAAAAAAEPHPPAPRTNRWAVPSADAREDAFRFPSVASAAGPGEDPPLLPPCGSPPPAAAAVDVLPLRRPSRSPSIAAHRPATPRRWRGSSSAAAVPLTTPCLAPPPRACPGLCLASREGGGAPAAATLSLPLHHHHHHHQNWCGDHHHNNSPSPTPPRGWRCTHCGQPAHGAADDPGTTTIYIDGDDDDVGSADAPPPLPGTPAMHALEAALREAQLRLRQATKAAARRGPFPVATR
eukprot:TRINITY_DN2920_c1_g1_i1.p1 TRINITY_DN2920_c1_g1~~TRINITY_DN2920_c1_g1_i1.p1  ORF type:complete len:312 (+),score=56.00 TRINITY_DN2920_c1_g1_i1:48-983(+)